MMSRKRNYLGPLAATLLSVCSLGAQAGQDPSMVYLHVSVTNQERRFITGLPADSFQIEEDKVPQTILHFSNDIPVTVALMVDGRKDEVEALKSGAVTAFATTDQAFFLERGDTSFHDAVYVGLNKLLQVPGEGIRAFVLIATGDEASSRSVSDIRELLKDQDIQFFVVGLGDPNGMSDATRELLRGLAEASGGESFFPAGRRVPESIYRDIARDLQYQYEIGYRPTNATQDGKWRKVTVSVEVPRNLRNPPRLQVRAKPGYYAPTAVSPGNR